MLSYATEEFCSRLSEQAPTQFLCHSLIFLPLLVGLFLMAVSLMVPKWLPGDLQLQVSSFSWRQRVSKTTASHSQSQRVLCCALTELVSGRMRRSPDGGQKLSRSSSFPEAQVTALWTHPSNSHLCGLMPAHKQTHF